MRVSSSDPIWTAYRSLSDECLYATFDGERVVEVTQAVLAGFWALLFPDHHEETYMKGMFAGNKGKDTSYKPALDGLGAANGADLLAAVLACISSGAAVQFSCTRDFGALCITVLDGNDRHKVYPTDAQEIAQAINDLRDSFTPEPPPSLATRHRARKHS